jgi:hypothetical protein
MQQQNQQKRSRRVRWLRVLRDVAIIIGFLAAVLDLVKAEIEFGSTVQQMEERHNKEEE